MSQFVQEGTVFTAYRGAKTFFSKKYSLFFFRLKPTGKTGRLLYCLLLGNRGRNVRLRQIRAVFVCLVRRDVLFHHVVILRAVSAAHRFDVSAVFLIVVIRECRRRGRAVVLRNPFVPPCQNNYLGSDLERVLPLSEQRASAHNTFCLSWNLSLRVWADCCF